MNTEPVIKGEIKFEDHAPSFTNATLLVYLENISVVDVSAEVVERYIRKNVDFPNNKSNTLSFEMAYRDLDERDNYAIRVHIDIDGDESVSRGDFISMQSYPVATFGHSSQVSILVHQVK